MIYQGSHVPMGTPKRKSNTHLLAPQAQYEFILSHVKSFDLQYWLIFLLIAWSVAAVGDAFFSFWWHGCVAIFDWKPCVLPTTPCSCSSSVAFSDQHVSNILFLFLVVQLVLVPRLLHTWCVSNAMNLSCDVNIQASCIDFTGKEDVTLPVWNKHRSAWRKMLFLWDQLQMCNVFTPKHSFKFMAIFHLSCKVKTDKIWQTQLHLTRNLLQTVEVLVRTKSKAQGTKAKIIWGLSNKQWLTTQFFKLHNDWTVNISQHTSTFWFWY